MSNKNLTPKMIMKEFLAQVRNELVMVDLVYRDFDAEITNRREGDTVYVRRPINHTVSDGSNLVLQDLEQGEIPITVDKRKHVGLRYTSNDMNLNMPEFVRKTSMKEAARAMAQQIDLDLGSLYKYVWNWVGTPGQTINSISDFTKAPQRLDEMSVPSERHSVLSTEDGWGLVNTQTGLNSADELVKQAYTKGLLGDLGGCMTYRTQQVRSHTVGTKAGTPVVAGANQNVTYAASADTYQQDIATSGWTNGTAALKQGDVITFADVFAVNPSNKDTLSYLQEFVVNEDVTADGSGLATFSISPPIIISGPYQTVNAAPANSAAIVVKGTASTAYKQNMVFHRNAFCFVPVPLITDESMPVVASVTDSTQSTRLKGAQPGTGLTFRMVRAYDINTDNIVTRIDTLYGVKAIRPELATRLSGTA